MQPTPEKPEGNYNEFYGTRPESTFPNGVLNLISPEQERAQHREIVTSGIQLVDSKVREILGDQNRLSSSVLELPKVDFTEDASKYPRWYGYYSATSNKIGIVTGNIKQGLLGLKKVFIHEYIHYLSHNGRDDREQAEHSSPLAKKNNVGFRREFGLDIRSGKEGQFTTDYFVSWNEGVTEQLAIDILPGVLETYGDYRGLVNQAVNDAVIQKIGANDASGIFRPWTREQIKNYVYICFFKGDLDGFSRLLQNIYKNYDISEQQFGLMTNRDDLPSVVESTWKSNRPTDPPPTPSQVMAVVHQRLNSKKPSDYETDIIEPGPDGVDSANNLKYGSEYDTYISDQHIGFSHREVQGGLEIDYDNHGYVIYQGDVAADILKSIRVEIDLLLSQGANTEDISTRMDELLFDIYTMSMLSEGFRNFYIYKHAVLGDDNR